MKKPSVEEKIEKVMVVTKRLGLAGYMKLLAPDEFVEKTEDGKYVFESSKTGKEWRLSYAKSDFSRYNAEIMILRQL